MKAAKPRRRMRRRCWKKSTAGPSTMAKNMAINSQVRIRSSLMTSTTASTAAPTRAITVSVARASEAVGCASPDAGGMDDMEVEGTLARHGPTRIGRGEKDGEARCGALRAEPQPHRDGARALLLGR